MSDDQLRALIRLIPPARALKNDLEKNIELELCSGTGDMAVQAFNGLHASLSALADSPYVASLALRVPDGANDKEKVSVVLLVASQLLAYLEGETGLAILAGGGEGGNRSYNSPQIAINNNTGLPATTIDSMLDVAMMQQVKKGDETGGE